jgi:flagellar assembly protein FliH
MKETRLSSICTSILPLEYQEAGRGTLALPLASPPAADEPSPPVLIGIPEDEVERRIQIARDSAIAEAEQRMRIEWEGVSKGAQEKVIEVLKQFERERGEYFRHVEAEVVQLALAISRKILQREAELDPTLLTALVRIALEQMQCGSMVRIRVAAGDADLWRRCEDASGSSSRWEIVPDEALSLGDCVVETGVGSANFGLEAQLRSVEESFTQLLAHRPDAQSRHAARA